MYFDYIIKEINYTKINYIMNGDSLLVNSFLSNNILEGKIFNLFFYVLSISLTRTGLLQLSDSLAHNPNTSDIRPSKPDTSGVFLCSIQSMK